MPEASRFDELGGEARLRAIVHHFVERVCELVRIGFFVREVDRAQLEHTARSRPWIPRDAGGDCDPVRAGARASSRKERA